MREHAHPAHRQPTNKQHPAPHLRLASVTSLSFVAMDALMSAMVDVLGNVLNIVRASFPRPP